MYQKVNFNLKKLSSFLVPGLVSGLVSGVLAGWYRRIPPFYFYALWPFSLLFRAVLPLRRYWLSRRQIDFKVPVVVVGNLTVGGTGKTPCVLALTQFFMQQGYQPALLTRGYQGTLQRFPHQVSLEDDPREVGDEPYLLAFRSGVPVIVDPIRNRGALYAQSLGATLLISDDGLQHYALKRDIEIVMVDGTRGFGNRCLLPMGPLREPLSRLNSVDFVWRVGWDMVFKNIVVYPQDQRDQAIPLIEWITQRASKASIAVMAGIGHPEQFFNLLRSNGLKDFVSYPFSDHHRYQIQDLQKIPASLILMTEKDMVKCREFKDPRVWTVAVTGVLDNTVLARILKILNK